MKNLKNTILAICFFLSYYSIAQDTKVMEVAFGKSYAFEVKYQYDEAIKVIKEIYVENSYPMNTRLGWLYYLKLDNATSENYYQKAVKLMPSAVEPLWAILIPQAAAEKWYEVEKTYLAILKLDPKNTTCHYQLGMIYYNRKNYTTAQKYLDIYLGQFPIDYEAMLMSAWTLYFLGKPTEAKAMFNKLLIFYQKDASALEGLSLIK